MSSYLSTKFSQVDSSKNHSDILPTEPENHSNFEPPPEGLISNYDQNSIQYFEIKTNQFTRYLTIIITDIFGKKTRFRRLRIRLGKSSRGLRTSKTFRRLRIPKK